MCIAQFAMSNLITLHRPAVLVLIRATVTRCGERGEELFDEQE